MKRILAGTSAAIAFALMGSVGSADAGVGRARAASVSARQPMTPVNRKPVIPRAAPARAESTGDRILGGVTSPPDSRPWQVSLFVNGLDPAHGHFCGGTLISTEWVVTAAHCMVPEFLQYGFRVLAGTQDLRAGGLVLDVDGYIVHEAYDADSHDNDIALVHLAPLNRSGRVVLPPRARAIPVAPLARMRTTGVEEALVTGFGRTVEGGDLSPMLLEIVVPVVPNDVCNQPASYGGAITENMICAGEDGEDSCQGDSGGPMVQTTSDGAINLVGVVSWGVGCGRPGKYGVYARVSRYMDWISVNTR
jgi:secreted trypsin-like serine protease